MVPKITFSIRRILRWLKERFQEISWNISTSSHFGTVMTTIKDSLNWSSLVLFASFMSKNETKHGTSHTSKLIYAHVWSWAKWTSRKKLTSVKGQKADHCCAWCMLWLNRNGISGFRSSLKEIVPMSFTHRLDMSEISGSKFSGQSLRWIPCRSVLKVWLQ